MDHYKSRIDTKHLPFFLSRLVLIAENQEQTHKHLNRFYCFTPKAKQVNKFLSFYTNFIDLKEMFWVDILR